MKSCMVTLLTTLYVFLVALVSFFILVHSITSYFHTPPLFFLVIVRAKKVIVVMILLLKSYISRHVFFLEHIHFFSILTKCHTWSKYDIICINSFLNDLPDSMPPTSSPISHDVPLLVTPSSPSIQSFPYHYSRMT